MGVEFDNAASVSGSLVTSLTTPSFAITGTNRVGILGLSHGSNPATSFSGSLGGVSATLIAGTDSAAAQNLRSQMWLVIAPPTGSQTGTMSWTDVQQAVLGVVTFKGVHQTTPTNNGTFASGTSATLSVTISSASGDMTLETVAVGDLAANPMTLTGPTKTSRWNLNPAVSTHGAGSSAVGAASNVHQWTTDAASPSWTSSGVNIVQASGSQAARFPYTARVKVV